MKNKISKISQFNKKVLETSPFCELKYKISAQLFNASTNGPFILYFIKYRGYSNPTYSYMTCTLIFKEIYSGKNRETYLKKIRKQFLNIHNQVLTNRTLHFLINMQMLSENIDKLNTLNNFSEHKIPEKSRKKL